MNCGFWEREIASCEIETPELRRHLAGCAECRRLADDISEMRLALGGLPEQAIESVQPLVMARISGSARPRAPWLGWAIAAAAALTVVLWTWPQRRLESRLPSANRVAVRAPRVEVPVVKAVERPGSKTRPATGGPMQVKIETNDPNVVIIWLVD